MSRSYLSDKNILVVSKPLVKAMGMGASIILRRIEHYLETYEGEKSHSPIEHFHDGHWWVFNGYQGWTDDIEIYSKSSIKRLLNNLERLGLLLSTCEYNQRKADRTKWYSIDYDAYDNFIDLWHQHGSPLHKDGKPSKQYAAFLRAWNECRTIEGIPTVGIPTVDTPRDHSSHTNGLQWTHQETTVAPTLPESPTEQPTKESQTTTIPTPHHETKVLEMPSAGVVGGSNNSDEIGEVFQFYEDNIGDLNGMIRDTILDSVGEFGIPLVMESLRIAAKSNKHSIRFVEGVWRNWRTGKIPTPTPAGQGGVPADPKAYTSGKFGAFVNNGATPASGELEESA